MFLFFEFVVVFLLHVLSQLPPPKVPTHNAIGKEFA